MSVLKTWWEGVGGSKKQDSDEEEAQSKSNEVTGEEKLAGKSDQGASANSWVVKGFGDLVSSVSGYANNLKESVTSTVQNTSFLTEFSEEQKRFERERQRQKDTAVPPWVGYNEEEQMKAQILELSADSRNVLRNPPPGIQFHFDFAKSYPVALALLKEDPRLQKLRFELVPKKLKEERFWHNYFYRVFLIRQSSQLASLASAEQSVTSSPHPSTSTAEDVSTAAALGETFTDDVDHTQAEAGEDFASDALVVGEGVEEQPAISRESVRAELDQLGVQSGDVGDEEWEETLAKELEDMGVQMGVEEGEGLEEGGAVGLDEHWEDELEQILDTAVK